jgi:hypothetical protein
MSARIIIAAVVSLTAALTDTSWACDPCGLHNAVQVPGVINSMRATGLQPGAVTLGAQQQVSTFNVRGENDLRTTNTDLELIKSLSVTQLSLGYNLSSSFATQINTPFIVRNYDRFERFRKVNDTESGIGDISLLGTYSPYSYTDVDSRFFVAAQSGIKLPTGDTGSLKRVASEDQTTADQRIQGRGLTLGTGSVDLPIGIVSYGRLGRFVGFGTAQYTVRGEGAADYRFASDLVWSVAPGYLFLIGEDESLSLSLLVSGENKGDDRLNGARLTKTSSNNTYVGGELFYAVSTKGSFQLALEVPVSLNVGGAAVEPELRARIGAGWSF